MVSRGLHASPQTRGLMSRQGEILLSCAVRQPLVHEHVQAGTEFTRIGNSSYTIVPHSVKFPNTEKKADMSLCHSQHT